MQTVSIHIPDDRLPRIAVGVLNYNRRSETLATLSLLTAIDYPSDRVRFVLIDNASSDGTVEGVREEFGDRVEILRMPTNVGVSARNRVMLESPEPYIFMFDDDSAPSRPETIRRAVEFMETNPYFGALCFHVRNAHSGELEFGDVAAIARRRFPNGAFEAIRVVGAGMCYRRDEIRRTHGYDPRIFWGAEEHDLALEMLCHGIPIALRPDFEIIHRQAPRAFSTAQTGEIMARNDLWVSFKHFPLPVAALVSSLHTLRWVLGALSRGDREGVRGVLRGARAGLRRLKEVLPGREPIPISTLARHGRWFVRMLNIFP